MASSTSAMDQRKGIIDLPTEIQGQIIAYVNRKDLFSLQTVSRHFHTLASAITYRDLEFNIISSENEDHDNPASRAAYAFQTILTSEYDYGQHIKTFRMGALADRYMIPPLHRQNSLPEDQLLMTRLLWDSKTDPSKFLNTSLLLVARKARVLESFKWDAPIELSSAVYQALHKIPSLKHLLIRLDVQPSPKIGIRHQHCPHPHATHPPGINPPPGPFPSLGSSIAQPFITGFESNVSKRRKVGVSKFWVNRRDFSGFRHLNTLEILGISNLDCLPEIAQCIKASFANLKSLTLTLSSELARRARKPSAATMPVGINEEISDTELDEDYEWADPNPPSASGGPQPASEADIKEEKLAQDNILATVFDLQVVALAGKKLEKKLGLVGGKCLENDDAGVTQEQVSKLLNSLVDIPVTTPAEAATRLEQHQQIKNLFDLYTKRDKRPSSSSKAVTSHIKSAVSEKQPTVSKAVSGNKKMNANASPFHPPGSIADYNPNDLHLPGLFGDNMSSQTFMSLAGLDPYASGSPSGKSSLDMAKSYGAYPGTGSWSSDLPPSAMLHKSTNGPLIAPPYPYSYPHSHTSSGSHTPNLSSSGYQPYANGYSASVYTPPLGMSFFNKSSPYAAGGQYPKPPKEKKTSSKAQAAPMKGTTLPSSDDSELEEKEKKLSGSPPLFVATQNDASVESMNVDIDHPDEDASDMGSDQEIVNGDDQPEMPAPPRPLVVKDSGRGCETLSHKVAVDGSSAAPSSDEPTKETAVSSTNAMQDYVRATHGLPLEELRLHWVPLKAAIVGRGLDLTVLQRVTLLDVGPQDTFWALLVRLTNEDNRIAFKSIHTDNVSVAFAKYLATYSGLEELFMHERNTKDDADSPKPIDIAAIRKLALPSHVLTLKKLMIRNERLGHESWEVDNKMLRFLALKCRGLKELACSMKMTTYHALIQMFAAFSDLHALHLIYIRTNERTMTMQLEFLNFAIDSLVHCPNVKLRYIAVGPHVYALERRPQHFRNHLKVVMNGRKPDRKGKGKAIDDVVPATAGEASHEASGCEADEILAGVTAGDKRLRFSTRFEDVKKVRIFAKDLRTGKL